MPLVGKRLPCSYHAHDLQVGVRRLQVSIAERGLALLFARAPIETSGLADPAPHAKCSPPTAPGGEFHIDVRVRG